MTLEEKIIRLKIIQDEISKSGNLTNNMKLIKEAFVLKKQVEEELTIMENEILTLQN
jgi:hypothetical protein